jgi:hypothetical protein
MVTLTHVDTSTGVLVDIKSFAQAIRKHSPNAIVVVDGVCASGGDATPFFDSWTKAKRVLTPLRQARSSAWTSGTSMWC